MKRTKDVYKEHFLSSISKPWKKGKFPSFNISKIYGMKLNIYFRKIIFYLLFFIENMEISLF